MGNLWYISESGVTMVNFGTWGNWWGKPGGTNRDGQQSAAFKKLSKSPLKLRLVRNKNMFSSSHPHPERELSRDTAVGGYRSRRL